MSLHDPLRRALLHPEEPRFKFAILFSLRFFFLVSHDGVSIFFANAFFSAFFLFFYAFFFSIENADSRVDGLNLVAF